MLLGDMIKGEKAKATKAIKKLPVRLRKFYVAQYGTGIGNVAGEYLGLSCKVCERWQSCGHDNTCPLYKKTAK